jgi:acyl-CoA reductase-like NAD-dependent aldehyde dehydrogenase
MRTLWIDGGWEDSQGGRERRIENPATLELVDEVVVATADDVRRSSAEGCCMKPRG